jgi:hypothetical protein
MKITIREFFTKKAKELYFNKSTINLKIEVIPVDIAIKWAKEYEEFYTWDGSSHKANLIFGERFGIDWEYIHNSCDIKIKSGRIIKLGEKI